MNPVQTLRISTVKNHFDQFIRAVNAGNYKSAREMMCEKYQHFYSQYRITMKNGSCNLTKYQYLGMIEHCIEQEIVPLRILNESWIRGTDKILFRGMGYYAFHSQDVPQLITQIWQHDVAMDKYNIVIETVISQ